MIDEVVQDEIERFRRWWGPFLDVSPELALDDTWPSAGVIDLLTFHLRLRTPSDWSHSALIRGSAAYLAAMAARCWQDFGADANVTMGPTGVVLTAKTGPALSSGGSTTVHVERELKKLLRYLPSPFPVLGEFSRMIAIDQNVISLFALGLCTGLTPLADEGPWLDETPESFKAHVETATKRLAMTSADRYARIFPDEPLGQVAELYLERLIYPPALMEEELPALGAVGGLVAFFHEYGVPREAQRRLAHNLTLSPDELTSHAGFCVYSALLDGNPSAEIQAIVQGRLRSNGLYRNAMMLARTELGLEGDWIGKSEYTDEIGRRFEIEKLLGFLPWIAISKKKLKESFSNMKFQAAIAAAVDFDREGAIQLVEEYLDSEPSDIEMRLQRIYLEAIGPESKERVYEMLRDLSSEPNADRDVRFNEMMATALFAREDVVGAKKHFKRAEECAAHQPFVRAELRNNLGWMLMQNGEMQEALRAFDAALETVPHSVTYLLNKGHVLWQLGRSDELELLGNQLLRLAPTNRSVFSILIAREAARRFQRPT